MFIALEGADGTGKTTLCGVLAERLGATSYSTPPKKYLELRTGVDRHSTPEESYRFYRDGIYDASDEISILLRNDGKVVCDRYWLSTYSCHQVMGVSVSKSDFQSIVFPTLTVLLALNHQVQFGRMLHRGMSVGDRRLLDKQRDITSAFCRNALEFNVPFLLIDTQRFSPAVCVEIIVKAIGF